MERTAMSGAKLRRSELAADIALPDADAGRRPVDVTPAQSEELTLPQSGHRGRQVQRMLGRAPDVAAHGAQQCLKLGLVKEADVGIAAVPSRLVDQLHWVARYETALLSEREDRVKQAEVVEDALRRLSLAALCRDESLNLGGTDSILDQSPYLLIGHRSTDVESPPDLLDRHRSQPAHPPNDLSLAVQVDHSPSFLSL